MLVFEFGTFHEALAGAWARSGREWRGLPAALSVATRETLPVDGASISVMTKSARFPLGASDTDAALAESLEFTIGQGPCLEACEYGIVITASTPFLKHRWAPLAELWFSQTPFRSALSLPLKLAGDTSGSLNLMFTHEHGGRELDQLSARQVARQIESELDRWVSQGSSGVSEVMSSASARVRDDVWVAVSMIVERSAASAGDALDLLRAWSYSRAVTVDRTAADLIAGRLEVEAVLS